MNAIQQDLPLPQWGGARRGAGRKRKSPRKNVPHVPREKFRRATLHVTLRLRREVWNLRTHRCFRALKRAFARGCERFGYRLVEFSVQGHHLHLIVEAPDAVALGRAMKGLEVRMARALNNLMGRRGPVFADRYHAHILKSPREAFQAIRYVLENWAIHAARAGEPPPSGVDPFCSSAWREHGPPLVAQAEWWMLRVGVPRTASRDRGYSA
ncbi:MAG TPA: transposase [Myxococcales bacterium]|nr:transposase [Myxococcales bacterium]